MCLTDKGASIHLAKTDAAIVATPEEIALIVHDAVIADGECDIHIAKINLAMLFIDVISKRADWYEYGLKLIESLKSQTQKKG